MSPACRTSSFTTGGVLSASAGSPGRRRRKANLRGKLFHDLRRTAARDMIRAGVSQPVVMSITGHRTVSMFQRYNITSADDMREAIRKTQDYRATLPAKTNIVAFPRE